MKGCEPRAAAAHLWARENVRLRERCRSSPADLGNDTTRRLSGGPPWRRGEAIFTAPLKAFYVKERTLGECV